MMELYPVFEGEDLDDEDLDEDLDELDEENNTG